MLEVRTRSAARSSSATFTSPSCVEGAELKPTSPCGEIVTPTATGTLVRSDIRMSRRSRKLSRKPHGKLVIGWSSGVEDAERGAVGAGRERLAIAW